MHQNIVVLDNGGGLIKAGLGGECDPSTIIHNCVYCPLSSKKWVHPSPTKPMDLTSATVRRLPNQPRSPMLYLGQPLLLPSSGQPGPIVPSPNEIEVEGPHERF
ncbi:hypothetical protein CerSpe_163530 [Prunus speciosa]